MSTGGWAHICAATPVIPEPQNGSSTRSPGLRVVQDIGDDAAGWNLGVVGVGVVDRVVLAFLDVGGKRRAFVIVRRWIVRLDVPGEKIGKGSVGLVFV